MEKMNLHHLGLFLDSDIILLKEETQMLANSRNHLPKEENDPVQALTEETLQENKEMIELIHEGNFEKGVLVVYEGNHLDATLREFLFKILNAVNCSVKDVALSSSESVEEIPLAGIQAMGANKIIVFGKIRHDLMQYKKQSYEVLNEDGVEYLFVDDLQEISVNVPLKKSLWEKLQVLFSIKK